MPPPSAYEELADMLLDTPDLRDLLQFDASQGATQRSKAIAQASSTSSFLLSPSIVPTYLDPTLHIILTLIQVKLNSFISRIPTSTGDMYTLQLDPKGC